MAHETPTHGFARLDAGPGTEVTVAESGAATELRLTISDGAALRLRLEVPLADAVGYWHPGAGANRTLPADWAGRTATSLVSWAPVGCLHDAAGRSLFAWALDELVDELEITFGVSEEHKTFALELHGRPAATSRELMLTSHREPVPLADAVRELATWLAGRLDAAPLTVPAVARRPVYSTWYTFTQDLDQTVVADETALAVRLGCGSVFVDDGWQRMAHGRGYAGCGDWVPDTDKFADLARFSATVHDHRAGGDHPTDHDHADGGDRAAGVVLWIAPLLLGPDAGIYPRLAPFAPHQVDQLRCFVLDPRHREVREHLAATCRRLVVDYDLDGLKIDFLDQAMVYRGTPSAGDVDDVGEAMRMLLAAIRTELAEAGRADCAVEFRQPYVSPAIGAYGQILRASDCPADAVVNRRSTIDARVLSAGQVVHGDMVMWGPTGGPEAVAQQLYGCWFAVPQISMRLADLPSDQSEALAGLLSLWQRQAPAVLEGSLSVEGSERNYDLVRAHHPELGQTVIGRYAPIVVDVDTTGEVTILNATAEDSVIVRLATGHTVRRGLVRGASATIAGEHGPLTAGVHEIAVPPFGSLTLVVSTHEAGGAAVSDPVDLLRGARHVVVQDYPSRDIPDALTRAGYLVTIYGGPTEADVVVSERSGGEIVHRRVGRYPEHADLLYTYRPVSEIDAILAEADRLGVRTVWRQPALGGEDVDAAEWRGRVEAAGLRYVDYPPIDEVAATVGH